MLALEAAAWYLSAADSKQLASKESVEDLVSRVVKFGERGGRSQTTIVTSPRMRYPARCALDENEAFARL